MVGLPVWLCAGKLARRPPATLPAMRARRDNLVSIAGMGGPLLGPGLPTGRHRPVGTLRHQDEPEGPKGPVLKGILGAFRQKAININIDLYKCELVYSLHHWRCRMFPNAFGVEFRRFENRQHEGRPARVVVAARAYDTDREDLWDALTSRERIPRCFLPIEGELELGGRYQLQGNAGGTITRCDPPRALDLTWEFGGGVSWVTVRLAPEGERTLLTLEHIVHVSDVDEHWARFGPGAVGVGWD